MNEECSDQTKKTAENWLHGDLTKEQLIARIIRVDHAGEYGAKRIYQGQLAVLGNSSVGDTIREMEAHEQHHLDTFDQLLVERRVRPTVLTPFWHVAGFALGAVTAMMGKRAAMACTVAVEEVIEEHYYNQAKQLGEDESELRKTIEKFAEEEAHHKDTGLEHEAELAPAYKVLSKAIKSGTKVAIWLSERI
tara:strand:+ start:18423 stop:18998 length:576 start_codon:yes stop_codon:yes gene_type:complete